LRAYSPVAQFTLVECLRRQGRQEEADAANEQYAKSKALMIRVDDILKAEAGLPSNDPSNPSEAGALLLLIGEDRQGEYWLQKALERDPWHQPTLKSLAEYYERKGEQKMAATYRRRLAHLEKDAPKPPGSAEGK
jgi:hypothetical protein